MSERRIRVGEQERVVDARREGDELRLRLDGGTETRFVVRRVGSAEFVVHGMQEAESLHTVFSVRDQGHWWVHVDGRTWHLEAIVEDGRPHDSSGGALSAPIPATVTEVLVAAGDAVAQGQVLIVLSAMKMQLEVKSPHDGTVDTLHCHPGDQVEGGAQLIEVSGAPA